MWRVISENRRKLILFVCYEYNTMSFYPSFPAQGSGLGPGPWKKKKKIRVCTVFVTICSFTGRQVIRFLMLLNYLHNLEHLTQVPPHLHPYKGSSFHSCCLSLSDSFSHIFFYFLHFFYSCCSYHQEINHGSTTFLSISSHEQLRSFFWISHVGNSWSFLVKCCFVSMHLE